jgi:hypothetical protein
MLANRETLAETEEIGVKVNPETGHVDVVRARITAISTGTTDLKAETGKDQETDHTAETDFRTTDKVETDSDGTLVDQTVDRIHRTGFIVGAEAIAHHTSGSQKIATQA